MITSLVLELLMFANWVVTSASSDTLPDSAANVLDELPTRERTAP